MILNLFIVLFTIVFLLIPTILLYGVLGFYDTVIIWVILMVVISLMNKFNNKKSPKPF